jgi:hypothetical protein
MLVMGEVFRTNGVTRTLTHLRCWKLPSQSGRVTAQGDYSKYLGRFR